MTGAIIAAVALLTVAPARAEPGCAPMTGGASELATVAGEARLSFLRDRLRHDARRARIWAWTWAGIYSGLTGYNAITLARATDRDQTIDASVGTAASAVGLLALAVLPPAVLGAERRFERRLAAPRRDGDRCALVAEGELELERAAASERLGHGPLIHAGNFLFNFGLGLLLGVGFGHWSQAAIVMLSGIAVGELQTITRPSDALESLERYRSARLDGPEPRAAPRLGLRPGLARGGASLAFTVDF